MIRSALILASLAVVGGGVALASPDRVDAFHGAGGPHPRLDRLVEELELTDTQRAQVAEILEAHTPELGEELRDGMRRRQEVLDLLLSDNPDVAAIHDRIDQDLAEHALRAHARADLMLDLSAVLTPAQRAEARELMAERRDRVREHLRHRAEGHGGAPL